MAETKDAKTKADCCEPGAACCSAESRAKGDCCTPKVVERASCCAPARGSGA